jgi:hypothetical protein
MWNTPTPERLAAIPGLGETQATPLEDKIMHLHFFIGGCDWYIAEAGRPGDDDEELLWGFACLHGDTQNAEFGYISFEELKALNIKGHEIDCELPEHFSPTIAREIPVIATSLGTK